MSVSLQQELGRLRRWIMTDLDRMLQVDPGPNYAAALLIVIATEGLSRLLSRDPHSIFVQYLINSPKVTSAMALDVWDALRNGLAHIYDTKTLKTRTSDLEIIVSWGKKKHLGVSHNPKRLYVNVRTMRNLLFKAFRSEESRLGGRERRPPQKWLDKRSRMLGTTAAKWRRLLISDK